MKKRFLAVCSMFLVSSLLFGCNNSSTGSAGSGKSASASSSKANSPYVKLVNSSVSEANSSEVTVKASILNTSDKAISLQPAELALIVNSTSTVLSPSIKSQIPSQVPANSTAQLSLVFENNGKIKTGDEAKIGYQPDSNQPEQFISLNNIEIKEDLSAPSLPNASSTEKSDKLSLLQANGTKVQLPIVWIKAKYGVTMEQTPSLEASDPLPDIPFSISSDLAKQLSAYWVNRGDGHGLVFLGPKDWIPTVAEFGADGSYMVTLQSQADSTNKLTYMSDGACRGCAIPDIGTYFKDLKKWASDQGFNSPELPFVFDTSNTEKGIATYQINNKINGYETIGAAHERTTGVITFSKEEITVPISQDQLAATITLFYAETLRVDS